LLFGQAPPRFIHAAGYRRLDQRVVPCGGSSKSIGTVADVADGEPLGQGELK